MSLKQLTIFVKNQQGALVEITDTLAKGGVNLRALSIADTKDFGILRLIVNDTEKAVSLLAGEDYHIKTTEVVGVKSAMRPANCQALLKCLMITTSIWNTFTLL